MSKKLLSLACCGSLAVGLVSPAHALRYDIQDLGAHIFPQHITNNGKVVGYFDDGSGKIAVSIDGDNTTTLNNDTSNDFLALGANDLNEIVGYTQLDADTRAGRVWQNFNLDDISAVGTIHEIAAINEFSIIGGTLDNAGARRGFTYNLTTRDLKLYDTLGGTENWVNDVHNNSKVTGGILLDDSTTRGFIYTKANGVEVLRPLEGFDSSNALSIGTQGRPTGYSYMADDPDGPAVATYWQEGIDEDTEQRIYLPIRVGTLEGDVISRALAVNGLGAAGTSSLTGTTISVTETQFVGESLDRGGNSRAFINLSTGTLVTDILEVSENGEKVLVVSTDGDGIFRSDDEAESWQTASQGLNSIEVLNMLADYRTDPATLYAAGNGGIFVSTDIGTSWTLYSTDLAAEEINTLKLHNNTLFVGTENGTFQRTIGDSEWRSTSSGMEGISTWFYLFDPNDDQTIYAGTEHNGVYISTDGGNNWTALNSGLEIPVEDDEEDQETRFFAINTMVIHEDVLFAGTENGVYALNDEEWVTVNVGLQTNSLSIRDFLEADGRLYIATSTNIFYTENAAKTWRLVLNGPETTSIISLMLDSDDIMYAGTRNAGFYIRKDDDTWSISNTGLIDTGVFDLQVYPNADTATVTDSVISATGHNGLHVLKQDAASWERNNIGLTSIKVRAIAVDPDVVSTPRASVYIGSPDGGIHRSYLRRDSQTNQTSLGWQHQHIIPGEDEEETDFLRTASVTDIEIDTTTVPSRIFVSTAARGMFRAAAIPKEDPFTPSNRENENEPLPTWIQINEGLTDLAVFDVEIDNSTDPATVFVGTALSGVFISTDSGDNWLAVNSGLTSLKISALLRLGSSLYAGTADAGIFMSDDDGASWQAASTGLDSLTVNDIIVSGTTLFAGTQNGVYSSDDNGASWQLAGLATDEILSLTEEASTGTRHVYAGSRARGVFVSEDNGSTWTSKNLGLQDDRADVLDLDSLITSRDNWDLQVATDINDAGQIIGYGLLNGTPHGFKLTPIIGTNSAELSVTMQATPENTGQHHPVDFIIQIHNNGPAIATNVTLANWLPTNAYFRTVITPNVRTVNPDEEGSLCTQPEDYLLICELNFLDPNDTMQVRVTVTPKDIDSKVRSTVRVVADQADAVIVSNSTSSGSETEGCFIATAAFGSYLNDDVIVLRRFRDQTLLQSEWGAAFVDWYYQTSPPIAAYIADHETLRTVTRWGLTPIVYSIKHPLLSSFAIILLVSYITCTLRRKAVLRK